MSALISSFSELGINKIALTEVAHAGAEVVVFGFTSTTTVPALITGIGLTAFAFMGACYAAKRCQNLTGPYGIIVNVRKHEQNLYLGLLSGLTTGMTLGYTLKVAEKLIAEATITKITSVGIFSLAVLGIAGLAGVKFAG